MSALFYLFLCFRSYTIKLEVYIPTFYKIRYILEELYVALMWIISRLIIYIDQLKTAIYTKNQRIKIWDERNIGLLLYKDGSFKASHTFVACYPYIDSFKFLLICTLLTLETSLDYSNQKSGCRFKSQLRPLLSILCQLSCK